MSRMTGGTARMVNRKPTPASQSRPNATQKSRMLLRLRRSPFSLCVPSRCGREWSSGAFEPLQRLVDLLAARLRLVTLLALAFDHVLGRAGDEIGVGELRIDAGNVGLHPRQFFLQPRSLGRNVDHALERQRRHLAANNKLHRAL